MHFSYSEFPNCRNNFYLSLTSYHILEDNSLQLLGDLDKYVVDMEPEESRLKVKFAIGA